MMETLFKIQGNVLESTLLGSIACSDGRNWTVAPADENCPNQVVEFQSDDITDILQTNPDSKEDSTLQLMIKTCKMAHGKVGKNRHLILKPHGLQDDNIYDEIVGQILRGQLTASKRGSITAKRSKATLVIVNPKSGVQKAREIYQKFVLPVLENIQCSFDYLVTNRANHAKMFVSKYPEITKQYDKIVIVSGDGLMHEVYQGLASRPRDRIQAMKIPVTMVPGGSGNAMAKSILHFSTDPDNPKRGNYLQACADLALSGTVSPMDLVRVRTCSGKTVTSFMSFGLGLLSDIDIESESLRVLGQLRFFIYGILRGINLKSYKCKVRYIRSTGNDSSNEWTEEEDDFVLVQCVTKPWMAETLLMAPQFKSFNDGVIWLFLIRKGVSKKHLFSWMQHQDQGILHEFPYVSAVPVTSVRIEPEPNTSGHMTVDGEIMEFGPIEAEILPACGNTLISEPSGISP